MARCTRCTENLIPIKATVLLCYGAVSSLLPLIISHAKHLGFTLEEISSAYGYVLLVSFFAPPVAGYFVDKKGGVRRVFLTLLLATGLFHSLLLTIPGSEHRDKQQKASMLCTETGGYLMVETCSSPEPNCTFYDTTGGVDLNLKECHVECQDALPNELVSPVIEMCFDSECYPFNKTTFPFSNISLYSVPRIFESRVECVHRITSVLYNSVEMTNVYCPTSSLFIKHKCRLNCSISMTEFPDKTPLTCAAPDAAPPIYSYSILLFFCTTTLGSALALLEGLILAKCSQVIGYGKQRMWAFVATLVATPVAYVLVSEVVTHESRASSFYPAFVQFDVLLALAVILAFITLPSTSTKHESSHFSQLFSGVEPVLLYGAIFALGIFWGTLDVFLFEFLANMDATLNMQIVAVLTGVILCIPAMYFADTILAKIGHANILITTFIAYAIQLICYAYIQNPWLVSILQLLNFITNALKVASFVTLSNTLAPKGFGTTMQGLVYSIHFFVGGGSGVLISSCMMFLWGLRPTFLALGISSFFVGIVYGITNFVCNLKQPSLSDVPSNKGLTSEHSKTYQTKV